MDCSKLYNFLLYNLNSGMGNLRLVKLQQNNTTRNANTQSIIKIVKTALQIRRKSSRTDSAGEVTMNVHLKFKNWADSTSTPPASDTVESLAPIRRAFIPSQVYPTSMGHPGTTAATSEATQPTEPSSPTEVTTAPTQATTEPTKPTGPSIPTKPPTQPTQPTFTTPQI